jgi:hypothetical protein
MFIKKLKVSHKEKNNLLKQYNTNQAKNKLFIEN